MKRLNSSNEDQIKIKTLCEFLFPDQFIETATFNRFELCFQPLFNNINISLDNVFKYICGEKKKYITYKRFSKAYLEFTKGKCQSKDTEKFFQFPLIIIKMNFIKFAKKYMIIGFSIFFVIHPCYRHQLCGGAISQIFIKNLFISSQFIFSCVI